MEIVPKAKLKDRTNVDYCMVCRGWVTTQLLRAETTYRCKDGHMDSHMVWKLLSTSI